MRISFTPCLLFALTTCVAAAAPATVARPGRTHGPAIIRERHGHQVSSANWSGYAVTSTKGSISDVKASWIVPAIAGPCPATDQYSSFWVGIDGYSSNTVEQVGTDSDCQNGKAVYYAWFEFYPHPSFNVDSVPVSPGDHISAEVTATGKGMFTVSLTNLSTGSHFTTSAKLPSAAQVSAEWIAEAPYSGGVLPLADFGTVLFGSHYTREAHTCFATISGTTGPIGLAAFNQNLDAITMDNKDGIIKATPSSLSTDGTSFSVAWMNPGP
jgi:Peptidase A4 family